MKNFSRTAANLLASMSKIDNSYYPEVSYPDILSTYIFPLLPIRT